MNLAEILEKVEWLKSNHPYGGACIRINSNKTIYFDPANLSEENVKKKADIVLLTHSHDDHFSIETIKKLMKPTTIIICPNDCKESLIREKFDFNIYVIRPSEKKRLNGINIEAVPAYSSSAHPHSEGWVGYVIELNGFRIYHSGDSGLTPEMSSLENIDIAFVTVREPYMMSPNEVIKSINEFKPKILIPIHWIDEEKKDIDYIINNAPESTKVKLFELK